jgi:hypothetical protein
MSQTPNIGNLVGKWTYRSFLNNPRCTRATPAMRISETTPAWFRRFSIDGRSRPRATPSRSGFTPCESDYLPSAETDFRWHAAIASGTVVS